MMLWVVAFVFATSLPITGATNAKGVAFLEENKVKEGVWVLPSGLQYKVLTRPHRRGALTPIPTSQCECHYKGTLIDGTEFDSSYSRGKTSTFAPNRVIKGWTEALQLMSEGETWELYIPSDLAYGDSDRGKFIKAGDVLVFKLELIKVKDNGFVLKSDSEIHSEL
ncbi:unnamed protein product [Polarella glacialis]|uniref:peptidylprolyl isomerase n=1 Tax=Polarella glacialis TaxID=89957 RepID=A0A813HYW3_POLGL|nr:unnamed protein product [Polarella glacialis]CAE8658876.1 unnamed protein product [Polarella glacialis]